MLIIPAVDIMGGQVVRLKKGDFDAVWRYGQMSPLDFAKKWVDEGAQFLHLVDLDGAKTGEPKNDRVIEEIVKNVDVDIEVGGGIRRIDIVRRYLDMGVDRIILSTKIIEDPSFLKQPLVQQSSGRIAVSIDIKYAASADVVTTATAGWQENGDVLMDIPSFLKGIYADGVRYLNFSDISRDGTMTGVDTKKISALASVVRSSVEGSIYCTYAGGVSTLDDLRALKSLGKSGVDAVIIGRALYENKFALPQALEISRS